MVVPVLGNCTSVPWCNTLSTTKSFHLCIVKLSPQDHWSESNQVFYFQLRQLSGICKGPRAILHMPTSMSLGCLSQSSWAAETEYHRLGALNNRAYFLTVLRTEVQDQGADSLALERPRFLPILQMAPFLLWPRRHFLCAHMLLASLPLPRRALVLSDQGHSFRKSFTLWALSLSSVSN